MPVRFLKFFSIHFSLIKKTIYTSVYSFGQALATGTYDGDLIFWRLETGQSYRRFNVSYPTGIFKLQYIKENEEQRKADVETASSKSSKASRGSSKSKRDRAKSTYDSVPFSKERASSDHKLFNSGNLGDLKKVPHVQRNLAIYCLLFLNSRETLPDQASLLVAVENGIIQV